MEQLLDALPDQMVLNRRNLKSSLYQPDRVSLNSQDDVTNENESVNPFYYNSYRIRLQRPCLNVKSLQLLRASVPTPIPSFPDGECVFFYYRLPMRAFGFIQYPNYNNAYQFDKDGKVLDNTGNHLYNLGFDGYIRDKDTNAVWRTYDQNSLVSQTGISLTPLYQLDGSLDPQGLGIRYFGGVDFKYPFTPDINNLYWVRLLPSYYQQQFGYQITPVPPPVYPNPPNKPTIVPPDQFGVNKQFQDYNDLVNELNKAALRDPSDLQQAIIPCRHIPGDITFYLDERLKKIYFKGNNGYIYRAASFNDPVINSDGVRGVIGLLTRLPTIGNVLATYNQTETYPDTKGQPLTPYRPLNLRLGYTWNNVEQSGINEPWLFNSWGLYNPSIVDNTPSPNYANSYGDLVNSSDLYVYVNFIGGSTLDSAGNGGLLAVVPLNTSQNCVAFYNNLMYQPALKIPEQISEIEVQFKDDAGNPFLLPNSAITNLEIGFQYF